MASIFKPGPWLLPAVALWWTLRLAGLVAMRAFGEIPLEPVQLAMGLLFDVLMLSGLFGLARASGTGKGSWLRGTAWLALLTLGMTLLRVADTVACFFGLSHMTETMWQHIAPGSLGYVLTLPFVATIAGVVAMAGALLFAALRDAKSWRNRPAVTEDAARARSLAAVGAFVCLLPPVLAPAVQDQHPQHWAIVPEVNAVATLGRTLLGGVQRQDPASVAIPTLPQATVSALKRAGVLAADADPTAPYPLLQPGPGALDTLAERPDAKARGLAPIHRWLRDDQGRPPNVLIVFVESLSTAFTGLDDRSRHAGLMPNLERLAGEMTTVRDFVNVSSPTANGLIASLCAALPSSAVQDIEVGGAVDGDAAYSCISDVLRGFGYRSHFVRGASKVYMACEATLRGHGFDQVIGREDLLRSHGDRPTNAWGFYDDTLMDVLIEEMDRLAKSQQPWLYATLTIGSHLPGYPDPSCEIPARYEDEPLLAGFHCTDRQIGRLVAHLKKTGLWESTVVVITGDHAELPTRKVEELVGRGPLFGSFAPMPLLIHDPLHRLPTQVQTLSGQLDLAPTLLHVLGAPPVEHTFMGWSIFGQRRHHPFIFGRMGRRLAHARSRTASRELPVGSLATLCERGEPLLADDSSPLSACDLDAYLRWLDALWQGHRLFPAERYRGVTGDPNLLRLKWLRYDSKEERQRRKRGEVERRPPPQ